MERGQREGEELCEMAALHPAPNICLSPDGPGAAAACQLWEKQEHCAVWERLQQGMRWAVLAGSWLWRSWIQVWQWNGNHFPPDFWVGLYELLMLLDHAANKSWIWSGLRYFTLWRRFFSFVSMSSCAPLLWSIRIVSLPHCVPFDSTHHPLAKIVCGHPNY